MEGGEAFATVLGMVASYAMGYLGVLLSLDQARRTLPSIDSVRNFRELCKDDWSAVRKVVMVDEINRKIGRLQSIRNPFLYLIGTIVVAGIGLGLSGIALDLRSGDPAVSAALREVGFGYLMGLAVLPSFILFVYAFALSRESAYAARRFQ